MNNKQSFKQLGIDLSSVVHPGEEFLSYEALLGLQENTFDKNFRFIKQRGDSSVQVVKGTTSLAY